MGTPSDQPIHAATVTPATAVTRRPSRSVASEALGRELLEAPQGLRPRLAARVRVGIDRVGFGLWPVWGVERSGILHPVGFFTVGFLKHHVLVAHFGGCSKWMAGQDLETTAIVCMAEKKSPADQEESHMI